MPIDEQPQTPPSNWEKLGIAPPESVNHGVTMDDVRANMRPAKCTNWRLIGNQLHCDTELGPLVQSIDPSYILRGVDEEGLPILVKVV